MTSLLLSKLLWIAKRPHYYPEFVNKTLNRIELLKEGDAMRTATERVGVVALNENEFLESFGVAGDDSFQEHHEEDIRLGGRLVSECGEVLGGATSLNVMYQLVREWGAKNIIETGVAFGWSTLAFLAATEQVPESRVYSTDFPQLASTEENVGLVVPQRLRSRWKLFRGADRCVLPRAIDEMGSVDLCHYDSDKSYSGRMFAYPLLWEALAPGGLFVSDDVNDNLAFLDFCEALDMTPRILRVFQELGPPKYMGFLVKPDPSPRIAA